MDEEKCIIILPKPAKFIRKDGMVVEVAELHVPSNGSLQCFTCGICGEVLNFYEDKRIFKCSLCDTEEENNCCCPENHYICTHCSCLKMKCSPSKEKEVVSASSVT